MIICESFGCKAAAIPFGSSTHLIPRRTAILLIGGDKTGNDRFYEQYVPLADALYDTYLEELRAEGLI